MNFVFGIACGVALTLLGFHLGVTAATHATSQLLLDIFVKKDENARKRLGQIFKKHFPDVKTELQEE